MCLILKRQLSACDIRLYFMHRIRLSDPFIQLSEHCFHGAEFGSEIIHCASNHSIQFLNYFLDLDYEILWLYL